MAIMVVNLSRHNPFCPVHHVELKISSVKVRKHLIRIFYTCPDGHNEYQAVYGFGYLETIPPTEERVQYTHFKNKSLTNPKFRDAYIELLEREAALFFVLVDKLAYGKKKLSWRKVRKEAKAIMKQMGNG